MTTPDPDPTTAPVADPSAESATLPMAPHDAEQRAERHAACCATYDATPEAKAKRATRDATPEAKAKRTTHDAARAKERRPYFATYDAARAGTVSTRNAARRDIINANAKARELANPALSKARKLFSSSRHRGASGTGLPIDLEILRLWYPNRCAYCHASLPDDRVTWDHVTPVSREGTNDPGNLVPACGSCNGRKGAKTPAEWLGAYDFPPPIYARPTAAA